VKACELVLGYGPGRPREMPGAAEEIVEATPAQINIRFVSAQPPPSEGGPIIDAERSVPVRISSQAEYDALPSGRHFIAPDGTERVKP
jgi:hypothetical protein